MKKKHIVGSFTSSLSNCAHKRVHRSQCVPLTEGTQHRRSARAYLAVMLTMLLTIGLLSATAFNAFAIPSSNITSPAQSENQVDDTTIENDNSVQNAAGNTTDPNTQDSLEGSVGEDQANEANTNSDELAEPPSTTFSTMAVTDDMSGLYTISTTLDENLVMDIAAGSIEDMAAVQLWSNNTTPAQRFNFVKNSDGTYTIFNVNSGKALDVAGANAYEGATVWQYTPNGSIAQKWQIEIAPLNSTEYSLVSCVDQNYVLGLDLSFAEKGARLQLVSKNGDAAQQLKLNKITQVVSDGTYIIQSSSAKKPLDVASGSVAAGANIQIYSSNNSLAQRFNIAYDKSTGYYYVANVNSGKFLDVEGAGRTSGSNVWLYNSNVSDAQKWAIASLGDGQYGFVSACSGLFLDLRGGSSANGTNVQVYLGNNTAAQKWILESVPLVGDNYITISSGVGTVLDVFSGKREDGTNIQTYISNSSFAQKYYMEHVGGEYYTLECLNSGSVVMQNSTSSNVELWANIGTDNQLWKPIMAGDGFFYLQNKQSGLMLDVSGASSAPGANVQTHTANNSVAQKWAFNKTGVMTEGAYVITAAADSSLAVDIADGSGANGATIQLGKTNLSVTQTFRFLRVSGDYFKIVSLSSGKVFDINSAQLSPENGSGDLQLYTYNGSNAQLWKIKYNRGKGSFTILSALGNETSCIDIYGGAHQESQTVRVYKSNNTLSQMFNFTSVSDYTTAPLDITIEDMIYYQRVGNKYIDHVSHQYLIDAIDPAISMQDYYYPGHYTYTGGVYQFADLRSYTGLSAEQINAIIESSYNGRLGNLRWQGASFVAAAQQYNLNENYLLAHAALESGWGTSNLAKGAYYDGSYTVDGSYYPAGYYYNFYGIGAYDSNVSYGFSMAIQNGWNSPSKAITGAAKWIAENYVYRSSYAQPTLYAMKWDYNRSNDYREYGWHQYATDHLWARKIANIMAGNYSYLGVYPSMTYIVPQYK